MEVRRENRCVQERRDVQRDRQCRREKHGAARTPTQSPSPASSPPGTGHSPYLFRGDHGDHVGSLLPHHLPEVMARVRQGPLGGNVVPFCPANHHLQTKESVGEATLSPGQLPADHGGAPGLVLLSNPHHRGLRRHSHMKMLLKEPNIFLSAIHSNYVQTSAFQKHTYS